MVYASDARWWAVYGAEVDKTFGGERWTCCDRMDDVNHVEAFDEPGLCTRPGRIHTGLNSGYQAIGLAFMWGASRIVLLGYDMMRGARGESHWHGDHEGGLPNLGTMHEWSRRMIQLAIDLDKRGIEVINCTRRTALQCFPKLPLDEALCESR